MFKQIGWYHPPHETTPSPVFQFPDGRRRRGELLDRPSWSRFASMSRELQRCPLTNDWIDAALLARSWSDRTIAFDFLISGLLNSENKPEDSTRAAGMLLTVAGEHLCEAALTEIDAAAFYSLTLHPQWRGAGEKYLRAQSNAKIRTWLKLHPGISRLRARVSA